MIGELQEIGFVFKEIFSALSSLEDFFDLSDKLMDIEMNITKDILNEDIEPISLKVAFKVYGPVNFMFYEVIKGTTYFDDFLKEKGGGFHHVGFIVKDLDESIKSLEVQGLKMTFNGIFDGNEHVKRQKFAYFDTKHIFGHDTELIQLM